MNLSLIFLVLSGFVAFLIYDMFKKSRQEQQIAQAQNKSNKNQPAGKLRPSYSTECQILKQLHLEKLDSARQKSISIHLLEQATEEGELSEEGRRRLKEVIQKASQTYKINLLICRNKQVNNPLVRYLQELKVNQIGFHSNEGAVAILRQLNSSLHLQGQTSFYKALIQYLQNVWVVDGEKTGENLSNQFKAEWQMLASIELIVKQSDKKKQE